MCTQNHVKNRCAKRYLGFFTFAKEFPFRIQEQVIGIAKVTDQRRKQLLVLSAPSLFLFRFLDSFSFKS